MFGRGFPGEEPFVKLSDKKILVVDDEPRMVDLLKLRLEQEGASVETATDGAKGFRRASLGGPDLVVMDLNMPGVNGFEAIRSLRVSQPELPVVVLTGYASEATFQSAKEAGTDACAAKPADLKALVATITAVLAEGRDPDEA